MSCPTELEWSMYVDAGCAAEDAARLAAHASSCAACRAWVGALEAETHALRKAMRAERSSLPIPMLGRPARWQRLLAAGAVLLGLAAGALVLTDVLRGLRLPEPLLWVPAALQSAAVDGVLALLVFIATEGPSMWTATIETAGAVIVAAVIVVLCIAAARAARARGRGTAVLSAVLAALTFASQSQALEIRRAEGRVSVPAAETIEDTVLAFGQDIEIDGTINGDLIAFAERIVIRGTVTGSLVAGARTVELSGELGGSVLGMSETLIVSNGVIMRDIYGFARQITAGRNAGVAGNAVVFAYNASLGGTVGKDVLGFANQVEVGGTIGGDLTAHGETVRVLSTARIDGDVAAHIDTESALQVSPDATIAGAVNPQIRSERADADRPGPAARTGSFLAREAVSFGAAFVTGLILLWLVPPIGRLALDTPGETATAAGIGLVTLVAVPIIALLTAVTLIGLPIAILAVLGWLALLYLAKIVVAHWIGRTIFDRAGRPAHFALVLLIGLLVVFVVINIPLLGTLLNFVLTIIGLGMLAIYIWGLFQTQPR